MMKPILDIEKVGLRYRLTKKNKTLFEKSWYWALQDISFKIYPGETLGIIGKNGAGKTSLLRLLAGIIEPDAGRVINHGVSVNMMGLQTGFIGELSGYDNIIITGLLLGHSSKKILEHIDAIIDFSELRNFIYNPIKTYSSGMRARLGFSAALHNQADVLLIDETLSVGDAEFKAKSLNAMHQIMKSNKTVVLTSHDELIIKQFCDRVLWIEEGVVRMCDKPDAVMVAYEQFTNELLNINQAEEVQLR